MHIAGMSLSNTISAPDDLGVQRSRKAVDDWVQKADLQLDGGEAPNQAVPDESVIRIKDQRYWLYAAINPDTNEFLHIRLFATYTTALTKVFLGEFREKHAVNDDVFLVDDADWVKTALQEQGPDFRHELHGNRNSIERVFRKEK